MSPAFRPRPRSSKLPVTEQTPEVVFQPRAHQALKGGVDALVNLLRPTLGPHPRVVALEHVAQRDKAPEILDDGATILRRILQLPNRDMDMGAMLLRHALWQLHQEVGDGTATAAVLFQALLREGMRYVTAGHDPMRLRQQMEQGLAAVRASLQAMARPLEGESRIAQAAEALCQDRELALLLGEIFDIVGAEGYVRVESGQHCGLEREYVEGVYWEEGWLSSSFATDPVRQEPTLNEPAILISDLHIKQAHQLAPVMARVVQAGIPSLLVIAGSVSDDALSILIANQKADKLGTLAVRAPSVGAQRSGILQDIAILTGGRVLTSVAGEEAHSAQLKDLGRARRAWANRHYFGIVGGRGDAHALRSRIQQVRAEIEGTEDADEQDKLRQRLGRLLGGVARLRIGASTQIELEARKAVAERAVATLRRALEGGVVPGGGAALLACQPALSETVGARILSRALEEPLRVIAENTGYEPGSVVARVRSSPPGWGFDARRGQIVDLWQEGILDPAVVLQAAAETAVSGAVMALTTEVLVHRRKPPESLEP